MPSNGVSAADLTVKLKGLDFPAKKQDLIKQARENKADEQVLRMLEAMPDQEFASVADVGAAIRQAREDLGEGEQQGGGGRGQQGEQGGNANEMARRGGKHSHDGDDSGDR
jgi:hypothetical protein